MGSRHNLGPHISKENRRGLKTVSVRKRTLILQSRQGRKKKPLAIGARGRAINAIAGNSRGN